MNVFRIWRDSFFFQNSLFSTLCTRWCSFSLLVCKARTSFDQTLTHCRNLGVLSMRILLLLIFSFLLLLLFIISTCFPSQRPLILLQKCILMLFFFSRIIHFEIDFIQSMTSVITPINFILLRERYGQTIGWLRYHLFKGRLPSVTLSPPPSCFLLSHILHSLCSSPLVSFCPSPPLPSPPHTHFFYLAVPTHPP